MWYDRSTSADVHLWPPRCSKQCILLSSNTVEAVHCDNECTCVQQSGVHPGRVESQMLIVLTTCVSAGSLSPIRPISPPAAESVLHSRTTWTASNSFHGKGHLFFLSHTALINDFQQLFFREQALMKLLYMRIDIELNGAIRSNI